MGAPQKLFEFPLKRGIRMILQVLFHHSVMKLWILTRHIKPFYLFWSAEILSWLIAPHNKIKDFVQIDLLGGTNSI